MIRISAYTFFIFTTFATVAFYFPLYFQHKGLSNGEIGIVMGMGSAISIFAQPFWGFVSDRRQTVKKVLLVLVSAALLLSIPLMLSDAFIQIMLVMIVFMFFNSATGPLTESLMIKHAYEHNRPFGSIRLWGEVGAGTASIAVGLATDHAGIAYVGLMYVAGLAVSLASLATLSDANAHAIPVTRESLSRLLRNRSFLLFLLLIMLVSIPHRMNDVFLPIYMQTLGGAESDVGVAWLVATLSAVPTMALSGYLFSRFNELFLLVSAALLYALRWLIYSFAQDTAVIVAGQALHMVTFPLVLMASVHFIQKIVPLELKATGQTLFTACFSGIGGIVGSTAGGWLMDAFPPRVLYGVGATLAASAALLVMLSRPYLLRNSEAAPGPSA